MDTLEVSEVMRANLCSVGYAGANTNIWHYHHAHSQWTRMKLLKYCGRICVVLDMLVLIPIFGTSTTHIRTHEVFEVVHAYLCSFKCASVKTNIWHMVTLKNSNPNPYTHSQLMHMTFLYC